MVQYHHLDTITKSHTHTHTHKAEAGARGGKRMADIKIRLQRSPREATNVGSAGPVLRREERGKSDVATGDAA